MANHMAEVAKMLGVELGEKFKIVDHRSNQFIDGDFYFTGKDIVIDGTDYCADLYILYGLLIGNFAIKRKPWRPKDAEYFSSVTPGGGIFSERWEDGAWDHSNPYKIGNCYRTREEAEANRDKWVAFYDSDDVLEV